MNDRWTIAAGLGAVTGLRSMTGLAMSSRALAGRWRVPFRADRLETWLSEDLVVNTVSAMALGEIIADKLPGIPPRIEPAPLLGRAVIGGLLGALAGGREERAAGIAVGVGAAVAATFLGWFVRREAGRLTGAPDVLFAAVEDLLAIGAAWELSGEL